MQNGNLPPKQSLGVLKAFDIEHLLNCKKRAAIEPSTWSTRSAMGLPLPDWQRPFEWTPSQEVKFIESLYLDLYYGVYVKNSADYELHSGREKKFSDALLDGQQRITTIENYLSDKFKVFNVYWSELMKSEQRRFLKTPFPCCEVSIWDERALKDLSDRLAFGGTAHREEYRATEGYKYNCL